MTAAEAKKWAAEVPVWSRRRVLREWEIRVNNLPHDHPDLPEARAKRNALRERMGL